jgi:putative tryptophan/tyrosine transport system substrate-binding protein
MRRREFIALVGGAAASWSAAARAQSNMSLIGFLGPSSAALFAERLAAFNQGLEETGFRPGHNVAIAYRWAGGDMSRLPPLAAELARIPCSIVVGAGLSATLAAKAATTTIPIMFFIGEDPVELGLVATLNRPGANLTGVTTLNTEVGPKRLELARELVPSAKLIALLINPNSPNADMLIKDMRAAAANLGLALLVLHASSERDFDPAFASLAEHRASALVITTDAFFISRIEQLARLTMRHAVPAIFQYRDFVAAGALMSYGGSFLEPYRQVGVYTGRVLKGESPAELPVQQATKVELFVNLKTAKALGLELPPTLVARADEVIE